MNSLPMDSISLRLQFVFSFCISINISHPNNNDIYIYLHSRKLTWIQKNTAFQEGLSFPPSQKMKIFATPCGLWEVASTGPVFVSLRRWMMRSCGTVSPFAPGKTNEITGLKGENEAPHHPLFFRPYGGNPS